MTAKCRSGVVTLTSVTAATRQTASCMRIRVNTSQSRQSCSSDLYQITEAGCWSVQSFLLTKCLEIVSLAQMFLDALHVVVFQLFMVLEQYE